MDKIGILGWNSLYPSHYSERIGVRMNKVLANRPEKIHAKFSPPSVGVEFKRTHTDIEAASHQNKTYRREDFVKHDEKPTNTSSTPDLEQFSKAFGSVSSEAPNYDPACDFDKDGDVDGSDLAVFAKSNKG